MLEKRLARNSSSKLNIAFMAISHELRKVLRERVMYVRSHQDRLKKKIIKRLRENARLKILGRLAKAKLHELHLRNLKFVALDTLRYYKDKVRELRQDVISAPFVD